jgi:hypothetical protein
MRQLDELRARPEVVALRELASIWGGGLHSLVHFSAQPEQFVALTLHPKYPLNTPESLNTPPTHALNTSRTCP